MPTPSIRRHGVDRSPTLVEGENRSQNKSPSFKHLQRVYPLGIHRSSSSLSLSPLSLSQNSNDSSFSSSISSWDRKITLSFHGILGSLGRTEIRFDGVGKGRSACGDFGSLERAQAPVDDDDDDDDVGMVNMGAGDAGSLKRCNWITKSSEEHYVSFHDECWGVPVYNDNRLFELLSLSGMLIDRNWSEILKKRDFYREAFSKFDPGSVAKMEEKDIMEISSNKELMLAESRVRCIVANAKCIVKVVKEFGSFSGYIWGHVNHKPTMNRYKHPRNVPLRSPKAEFISKDLVRRGFRLVGPVIVYSFMQAAGMVIDHLLHCFRFSECVKIAERSWGITNMAM